MTKLESLVIKWVIKRKNIVFLTAICIIGFIVRWSGINFVSPDMREFLLPWFEKIKENGFSSLSNQVGDYNLLYQTIIVILTKIDVNAVVLYKAISIVGDYYLAFNAARLVCAIKKRPLFKTTFNIVFAAVLILPTVVLNSAFWGQCDSIYSAFLLATLFYAYRNKWIPMAIVFGLAFAFKLQAIFILPFLIIFYFYNKKFSVFYFVISACVFWASGIVCYIKGRNILDPIFIYLYQTNEYKHLYMNYPSYWMLIGDNYFYAGIALLFTVALFGIALYLIVSDRVRIETPESWAGTACWCVWTCVLFLPAMHERYSYIVDILLVLMAFIDLKYAKYAVVTTSLSLYSYSVFLNGQPSMIHWYAVINIAAYLCFTVTLIKRIRPEVQVSCEISESTDD